MKLDRRTIESSFSTARSYRSEALDQRVALRPHLVHRIYADASGTGVMRVAIVTDGDLETINGLSTALRAVLRHAPPDIAIRVYSFAGVGVDAADYRAFRSPVVPIPFHSDRQLHVPLLRRLGQCLWDDGVDLIHLTTPGPAGLAGRYLGRRMGLPLIGSIHRRPAEDALLSGSPRMCALMQRYERWFYSACHCVLVPSSDTRSQLIAAGWQGERFAIWSRGVDAALFTPARRSRVLRERWRVADERPAILCAGRVSREKGLDMIAPIESLLFRAHVPHRFIVAGDGPMLSGLKERLSDAVFMGLLSHDDLAAAMASADVFLFPSATDTAGTVVLEAQASGLPVLVSAGGGPKEIMIDGKTGFVCRPGDPPDFAERLRQVLADSSRRQCLSANARAFASTLSWGAALAPLFAAYRRFGSQRVRAWVSGFPAAEQANAEPK